MNLIQSKKVQISKEGLEALEKELRVLVDEKRPKLVERLEHARNQGDLAENSDYTAARDELEFLDGRISELEEVIDNAVVVNGKSGTSTVAFGTKVTLAVDKNEIVYEIVGAWEADPLKKRISHESPLGQALLGKKVGDKVEIEAPAGKIVYTIVKID